MVAGRGPTRVARTAVTSGAVLSLGAAMVGPVPPAGAATFTVTSAADGPGGTLREAIHEANDNPGVDEITFAPGLGPITLTYDQIRITEGVTITGPGASALTVSGNDWGRIFYIDTGDAVTISGLTLTSGRPDDLHDDGGAIRSVGADLTIQSTTIQDSQSPVGGGAVSAEGGSLTLVDSVISGNTIDATGGGIHGGGVWARVDTLTVTDTAFTGNTAGAFYGYGGGLDSGATTATITGSTFEGNQVSRGGGAALFNGGDVTIDDTTVTNNSALFAGGLKLGFADTTITGSTISDNDGAFYGGGIGAHGGTLTITGSTIAGNDAPQQGIGGGGGVQARQMGAVTIDGTTVSGNAAPWGGGLLLDASTASIASSTISGNHDGGGIVVQGAASGVSILHSTIAGNDGDLPYSTGIGGLLVLQSASASLDHTVVGDNTSNGVPADLGGTPASVTLAHSLVEAPAAGVVTDAGGNVVGVDAGLSPLGDNGGPTETHAITTSSPAFDAGDAAFVPPPATDQRGQPRVSGDAVDIGAFELQVTPEVLPGGATVTEGNSGTRVVNVRVRLSTASGFPVTVDWATLDSVEQPAEGVDYQSASGTVTFAPGETLKTVPVTVLGDTTDEPNEWVPVAFTNPINATISGYGLGFGVIRDDDPAPSVVPGGGAVHEGDTGSTTVLVKVKLSSPSGFPVTVDWATLDSVVEPAEGVDYQAASGSVTFAPGETLKLVPITILGDTTDEPDEWVPVAFSNPTNATISGYGLGFGVIRDDD